MSECVQKMSFSALTSPSSFVPYDADPNYAKTQILLDYHYLEGTTHEAKLSIPVLPTGEGKKGSLLKTLNVNTISSPVKKRPLIVGHRGSPYRYPENTVRSFLECLSNGCDFVEMDVFVLKCGTLAVFHGDDDDGLLKACCNVDGYIADYTASEAREKLKLNPFYDDFGSPEITFGEEAYVPTLEEVLCLLKGKNLRIKIELKGSGTSIPVLRLVEKLEMVEQCEFASFEHDRIEIIRNLRPQVKEDGTHIYKTGALFRDDLPQNFIEVAKSVGASAVQLKYDTCTKDRVSKIHDEGMESMCWFRGPRGMKEDVETKYFDVGNEDFDMYEAVMNTGVGAMCVNKPDVLNEFLRGQTFIEENKKDKLKEIGKH